MDSLTHLFVGGAIAAAIAPARHRRAALLAGAALNTLPDLDVLPLLFADPVVSMTWHRGPSHSLLVLPLLAWALWAWFKRRGGRVAEAPRHWFWVFQCALLAHPLIDACTIYGTQLLWPLPLPPVMWSTLSMIDPLMTLPLLLGCVAAWWARDRLLAQRALVAGLLLATAYLGWSVLAKGLVERDVAHALAGMGLADAPRISVPRPFTTLQWRVLAMTPDGFIEAQASPFGGVAAIHFSHYDTDADALASARATRSGARLLWFNHGFAKAEVRDDLLVVSDLRMGSAPDYTFNFAVARRDERGWREMVPVDTNRQQVRRMLKVMWERFRAGELKLQRRKADS